MDLKEIQKTVHEITALGINSGIPSPLIHKEVYLWITTPFTGEHPDQSCEFIDFPHSEGSFCKKCGAIVPF